MSAEQAHIKRTGAAVAAGTCLLLVALLAVLGTATGPDGMAWEPLRCALAGDPLWRQVVVEIRLPRTVLAVLAGMSLGLAGAALQGYTRNPLAEPGVLGISGGASLGAVLGFYTGFSGFFPLALPLAGLAGAGVCTLLIALIAGRHAAMPTLILAGVAVGALTSAATALALNLSPNPYAGMEIVFWLMGSLQDRHWSHIGLILPFLIFGWILLLASAPSLQALTLGESAAASMGVSLGGLKALLILGTAMAVGPVTAVTGGIGFVGLVVPHLLRPLAGADPGRLLPLSALGGAALVLAADLAVRLLPGDNELRIGVLTSLLGVPFFFYLILKMRRTYP